jgi:DNA-binding transcriptional regulator YdaS (Cro superfamily)
MDALEKAIAILGSRSVLARKIGYTPQLIGMMINGKARISAEVAMAVQIATDHSVMVYELRPDLPWLEIMQPKKMT